VLVLALALVAPGLLRHDILPAWSVSGPLVALAARNTRSLEPSIPVDSPNRVPGTELQITATSRLDRS